MGACAAVAAVFLAAPGCSKSGTQWPGTCVSRASGKLGLALVFDLTAEPSDAPAGPVRVSLRAESACSLKGVRFGILAPAGWTLSGFESEWTCDLEPDTAMECGFTLVPGRDSDGGALAVQAVSQNPEAACEERIWIGQPRPAPPAASETDSAGNPVVYTTIPGRRDQ